MAGRLKKKPWYRQRTTIFSLLSVLGGGAMIAAGSAPTGIMMIVNGLMGIFGRQAIEALKDKDE